MKTPSQPKGGTRTKNKTSKEQPKNKLESNRQSIATYRGDDTAPGLPKFRDQTDILDVFQDGSIEFPQAWTRGNDVGHFDRDLDPTVI